MMRWHQKTNPYNSNHKNAGASDMPVWGAWVDLGAQITTAVNIALMDAASPMRVALGDVFWLGERFSWQLFGCNCVGWLETRAGRDREEALS
jgi:hypothetical protein